MPTAVATPRAFSPGRALSALLGFSGVGLLIAVAHVFFDIGLPCPLLTWTGIQCPLCGATRAAGALLTADVRAAWGYNAMIVIAVPVLALAALAWTIELLGGPSLRPPGRFRPVTQNKVYVLVGFIAVVFMIVRNVMS